MRSSFILGNAAETLGPRWRVRQRWGAKMDYKSKRWKKLRERILKRDGYMCQVSKRYGRMAEANTVHHIYPADEYPEYQWCEWNLISLSQSVHNEMHVRDTDELTEKGKALQRRVEQRMQHVFHN